MPLPKNSPAYRALTDRLRELDQERREIERFLGGLIKKPAKIVKKQVRKVARRRVQWTAEMRAAAARRMKARWKLRKTKP
jgi:hypothetical protein